MKKTHVIVLIVGLVFLGFLIAKNTLNHKVVTTQENTKTDTNFSDSDLNSLLADQIKNGSTSFDIDEINGMPVSLDNTYAKKLQQIVRDTPGYQENYGPFIMDKVSSPGKEPISLFGKPEYSNLVNEYKSKIHVSVFP